MSIIASIAYYFFLLYFLTMWVRFVLDLVRAFSRSWRPRGVGLLLAEAAYSVTDPPIKFFRRVIRPVNMGPISLDFGWSITMLICIVGMYVSLYLR